MTTGMSLAEAGFKYLGTPYSEMDCQAYVERCLRDCGIRKDLAGSNAWYRLVMREGWVGTPEECKAMFGFIPVGAFLFILKQDGREPAKYIGDGIGNASHIGIYTGKGEGAINSSSSRGCVCESRFRGKSINGGWNRVGLWNKIDYGKTINSILNGGKGNMEPYQAQVIGGRLNLREQPSTSAERICQIPDGTIIEVTDETGDWAKVNYGGREGWVRKDFLKPAEGKKDGTVEVDRAELEKIYDKLGDWLGLRG